MAMPQKNLNTVENWKELVRLGVDYRNNYGNAKNWHTYRQWYRNKFDVPDYNFLNEYLPYNITYMTAKTIVPSIYFRNPVVSINPRYGKSKDINMRAKVVEAVDNWLIQELNLKKVMKQAILEAFFTGKTFLKVGYDSQYGFSPDHKSGIKGITDSTLSFLSKNKNDKQRIEYNTDIKAGMPFVTNRRAEHIAVPFGTESLNDCWYLADMYIRCLEDVKKDMKYKNTENLMGTHIEFLKQGDILKQWMHDLNKEGNHIELVEIHDVKRREVKVFSPAHDKWLRAPESDLLQIEGLPYVELSFNDDPEHFWSI